MSSLLIKIAKERFDEANSQPIRFVENDEANEILNNLEEFPHFYVLASLMDRQIKAERARLIPHKVCKEYGTLNINGLQEISLKDLTDFFNKQKLHRFNDKMAGIFHAGVNDIVEKYNGNASNIWSGTPSSASVVYKFLCFKGSGIKISTMATNILARQFRIPFADFYSIDISPDVHIKRIMQRMGYVPGNASDDMIIYKAREIYPEFPGMIDFSCWEIGRTWCKPKNPLCSECSVNEDCKKIIV